MAKIVSIKISDDILEMMKELAKKKGTRDTSKYISDLVREEYKKLK
jgi:metal-responsive CopG/Arc/MetJ family transcriptional regulator